MLINAVKGITAFVTGGGSGLGLALCKRLSQQGARVVTLDLKPSEEAIENVLAIKGDIRKDEDVNQALDKCRDEAGKQRLNLLVNCAGVANAFKVYNFTTNKPQRMTDFMDLININVIGTFNVIRLAVPLLAENDVSEFATRGAIVNTSSILAYEGHEGQTGFAVTQGAINSMTLPLSRDLSHQAIRVNTIAVGFFDTPLVSRAKAPELLQFIECATPCPSRLGNPDEFAQLAISVYENNYINGEVIRLDGAVRWPERG